MTQYDTITDPDLNMLIPLNCPIKHAVTIQVSTVDLLGWWNTAVLEFLPESDSVATR